jgi:hypothetical protein
MLSPFLAKLRPPSTPFALNGRHCVKAMSGASLSWTLRLQSKANAVRVMNSGFALAH